MLKPELIPLRPIGVGEILTGAFAAVRRNPGATLGISAVQDTSADADKFAAIWAVSGTR